MKEDVSMYVALVPTNSTKNVHPATPNVQPVKVLDPIVKYAAKDITSKV